MGARAALLGLCLLLASAGLPSAPARADPGVDRGVDPADWEAYARRFVSSDGRVIDADNGGISHSEGQGTAMLLAAAAGDQAGFDRIRRWTDQHLKIRGDALYAWRWQPGSAKPVGDHNDAADGDLLIAWALATASARWSRPEDLAAARAIAERLRTRLVRRLATGPILLPAETGFEDKTGIVVNLSYGVLPAYAALGRIDPDPIWAELAEGWRRLVERARLGRYSLPPDWLLVPKGWSGDPHGLAPWPERPPRFGWDAIRVPLYLAWGGADGAQLWPFLKFWSSFADRPPPPWIDLKDGSVPAEPMPPGFWNIRRLDERAADPAGGIRPEPLRADEGYYSASLTLLATMAVTERFGR